MKTDWQEIVNLKPKGFLRIKTAADIVIYGPIDKIALDSETNEVSIGLNWLLYAKFEKVILADSWKIFSKNPIIITKFPNGSTPYKLQKRPQKGNCILFFSTGIFYVDYFETFELPKALCSNKTTN